MGYCRNNGIIGPSLPEELPWRLEQLEKLGNNLSLVLSGYDGNQEIGLLLSRGPSTDTRGFAMIVSDKKLAHSVRHVQQFFFRQFRMNRQGQRLF